MTSTDNRDECFLKKTFRQNEFKENCGKFTFVKMIIVNKQLIY